MTPKIESDIFGYFILLFMQNMYMVPTKARISLE